jgi:hypothetical protein
MEQATPLIGRKFSYKIDEDRDGYFEIIGWRVRLLKWLKPVPFRGEYWYRIADIVWQPGKFSFLYFNGDKRLIAIDHTLLAHDSIVRKEYEV